MLKKLKFVAIVLLAGILIFNYRSEIQSFLNSLPFSIPFLTEESEDDENMGSFEYYFKDNKDNVQEESQEESVWNIYEK